MADSLPLRRQQRIPSLLAANEPPPRWQPVFTCLPKLTTFTISADHEHAKKMLSKTRNGACEPSIHGAINVAVCCLETMAPRHNTTHHFSSAAFPGARTPRAKSHVRRKILFPVAIFPSSHMRLGARRVAGFAMPQDLGPNSHDDGH